MATLKEKKADLSSAGPSVHDRPDAGRYLHVADLDSSLVGFYLRGLGLAGVGFGSPKVPAQEELFHFVNFALAPFVPANPGFRSKA